MEQYTPDKYSFRKYLLNELEETRQEELIFWKKTIPMPVDLIYDIYEKRGTLLAQYMDHIGAAYLFTWSEKQKGNNWEEAVTFAPSKKLEGQISEIRSTFHQYYDSSRVEDILSELAEIFMVEDYFPDPERLVAAMLHHGKKYERLYYPKAVREIIKKRFDEFVPIMAQGQTDMFSNVVADELNIYRMGFADAFAGIFNRLIDFVLMFYYQGIQTSSNANIKIKVDTRQTTSGAIEFGNITDGAIWEPAYKGSAISLRLNEKHPFITYIKKGGENTEKAVSLLLHAMAEIEYRTPRDGDKKIIENFRQELSRALRLKMEDLL